MSSQVHREASHAGSWYDASASSLTSQLKKWLEQTKVSETADETIRAIIAPHAGLSYSGSTAAWSYRYLQLALEKQSTIKRLFILGPSHHYYTKICSLSKFQLYDTPISQLQLDTECIKSLHEDHGHLFEKMTAKVDEEEHSIEMQLPFVAHILTSLKKETTVKVVPVLVGSLSNSKEQEFGKLFAPFLEDSQNFFIISSDFCHWGKRFGYTYYNEEAGEIWESIQALDTLGMQLIEKQDASGFAQYLSEFRNTICGRHPIAVLLNSLNAISTLKHRVQFVAYAQSSKCKKDADSSVSYAAAVVTRRK